MEEIRRIVDVHLDHILEKSLILEKLYKAAIEEIDDLKKKDQNNKLEVKLLNAASFQDEYQKLLSSREENEVEYLKQELAKKEELLLAMKSETFKSRGKNIMKNERNIQPPNTDVCCMKQRNENQRETLIEIQRNSGSTKDIRDDSGINNVRQKEVEKNSSLRNKFSLKKVRSQKSKNKALWQGGSQVNTDEDTCCLDKPDLMEKPFFFKKKISLKKVRSQKSSFNVFTKSPAFQCDTHASQCSSADCNRASVGKAKTVSDDSPTSLNNNHDDGKANRFKKFWKIFHV